MADRDNRNDLRPAPAHVDAAESASDAAARIAGARKPSNMSKQKSSSQSASSAVPLPTLRKSSSTNWAPQASSPLAQSPQTSRSTSPTRRDKPPTPAAALSAPPSAAAIQRALSASSVPQLPTPQYPQQGSAVTDAVSKLSRGSKSGPSTGENTPQWPISPRLKSPPPSGLNSRRGSAATPRKSDVGPTPSTQSLSTLPQTNSPQTPAPRQVPVENVRSDTQLQAPPAKTSGRGPSGKSMLETVQENITDSQEPSPAAVQAAADLKPQPAKPSEDDSRSPQRHASRTDDQKPGESGSESAGNKSDSHQRGRRPSSTVATSQTQPLKPTSTKNSYALSTVKSRTGDGKPNMTVETETVQSIPQSGLAPANEGSNRSRGDNNGTLRLKPSTETIRPRKERKRTERKTRNVNQGSATSKADLFEARVANQVDEQNNTSDSEETFVYESNPPEPHRRQRHHSRTPSVTSSHSVAEQQRGGTRTFNEALEDRRIGGKRSMKFSSNPYQDLDSPESKDGTVRSHTPRHIGRYGRGGHHSATYDSESTPAQAHKPRHSHLQRSRPDSPRSQGSQMLQSGFMSGTRKQEQPYDFDAEQNADDERAPLMGTVRANRQYRSLRRVGSSQQFTTHSSDQDRNWRSCCSGRTGPYILTAVVVVLVILSAAGLIFASNQTLEDVEIESIHSVLATEQELMFDLMVGAVNPNLLPIIMSDIDLNIFAKSKHVSLGHSRRPAREARATEARPRRNDAVRGVDKQGSDPSEDLSGHWHAPKTHSTRPDVEQDAQTMLLGRIFHFDQGITFEPSVLERRRQTSSGQLRLVQPGNRTESGGSARWEKVIQSPFELIVRGVLKYQLPISSRQERIAVGGSVMVHPEEGLDNQGNMRVEPIDDSEHWQWIDWPPIYDGDGDDNDDDR